MRKINLRPYEVQVPNAEGKLEKVPLEVSKWIQDILFHPELKLDGREVILRGKLADKIANAGDEVLLEDSDYHKVKVAFETVKGFGKIHIELLNRVFEAQEVKVEEKKH